MARTNIALLLLALAPTVIAFAAGKSPQAPGKASASKSAPPQPAKTEDAEPEFARPSETVYEPKVYTKAEIAAQCHKYEGKFIAFYGDVWKVVRCQRRPVLNARTSFDHTRSGGPIIAVEEQVIAMIPEGEPIDRADSDKDARPCKALEHQYVSFSSVDIYYVEQCKKRLFPDWATYIKHREQRGDKKGEILALSWHEFRSLETGEPLPSIIDDIFAKMLKGDAGVEVIPVDEACEGVEGKVASYYSRLYRIEKCKKREIIDPDLYVKRQRSQDPLRPDVQLRIVELRSEQWLSLPDGEPIALAPAASAKDHPAAAPKNAVKPRAEAP